MPTTVSFCNKKNCQTPYKKNVHVGAKTWGRSGNLNTIIICIALFPDYPLLYQSHRMRVADRDVTTNLRISEFDWDFADVVYAL